MTKPRPDQPGRWRKGSPRIEWDRERADRLQEEVEEYDATLTRQSDLLTRTVNALRGDPPPLTSWSHHDIPELAAEKVAEVERLTAERDAAIERLERVIDQWRETGRAVISEMDRADKAAAERDALAGLLAEFVDSEPCSLDHHGYCQSHGHLDEGECHMARARAALAGSEADHDMPTENWTCPRCNRERPAQVWVCDCVPSPQSTDPGCGCSTNPARARYADGDPAGCYCTCSDDAREDCEHEPDEPQPTDQEDQS